jgi:hypothetical protein
MFCVPRPGPKETARPVSSSPEYNTTAVVLRGADGMDAQEL